MNSGQLTSLKPVELGTMLRGGHLIEEDSINAVWKSHVSLEDKSEIVAFVKVLPDRDLFVECACAVLGRRIGLPIPEPLIVFPTQEALDKSDENDQALAFGSVDAAFPSFYKFLSQNGMQEDWDILEAGGFSIRTGVFDEWIANTDRHLGNILVGGNGDFALIDHTHSIPDLVNFDAASSSNKIVEKI